MTLQAPQLPLFATLLAAGQLENVAQNLQQAVARLAQELGVFVVDPGLNM